MPWIPGDAAGNQLLGIVFPKMSLRSAHAHRLDISWDVLAGRPGQFWTQKFQRERDRDVGVRACYLCLQELTHQGSGVVFDAMYWSLDWQVQWLHVHYSKMRQSVRQSETQFVIYPP